MYFSKIRLAGLTNVDLLKDGARPSDPYIFKSADGLGAPEGDVSIQQTLYQGGVYQGRRPQLREIVIRVGLNPNWNVGQTSADLRDELYGLLTPSYGEIMKVQLMDDTDIVAQTDGVVKRIEPVLFAKEPEAQITISCTQSYLTAPIDLYLSSLAKVIDGSYTIFDIPNAGTAPSGFYLSMVFNSDHGGSLQISQYGVTFGPILSITPDTAFAAGDQLEVNTIAGQRGLWVTRSGSSTRHSLIDQANNAGANGMMWLQLHGGLNRFKVNNTDFAWGPVFAFMQTPAFWGV